MNKLKYILKCLKSLNVKNMFKIAKKIAKKTHKLSLFILIDIIYCGIKYGAGYYDYQEFEFYNLTRKERKTYLTRTKNNLIIKTYNDSKEFYKFDNKEIFNEIFKKYLKRDYIVINKNNKAEFMKFINKHTEIICKPVDGSGGHGITKYVIDKDTDKDALYENILISKSTLCEECIKQHDEINKLYKDSVNTLRLFTFITDQNDVVILNSIFKIGNGGVTDNFSSGSMYTFLNEEGKIIAPAIDQEDHYYSVHPLTKAEITGFTVPMYEEACQMVKDASKLVPKVRYVGWDVAITNDGPVIIEGNSYPGIFQIKPSFTKNHNGLLTKYQKYMDIF